MKIHFERDQAMLLESASTLCATGRQANDFLPFCFFVSVGMYNKTLTDWLRGKQRVLFPLDLSSFFLSFALENIEGLWETKLTVCRGARHNFLIVTLTLIYLCVHRSSDKENYC